MEEMEWQNKDDMKNANVSKEDAEDRRRWRTAARFCDPE